MRIKLVRYCPGGEDGRNARWRRVGHAIGTCAGVCALTVSSASAEIWRFLPSIAVEETLTNNVNLDSNATRRTDWVSQITPGVTVTENGARSSLAGQISLPILIRARTGSTGGTLAPQVSLRGHYEAIPRFFFIEGAVSVTQQYLSPFGARSVSLANATSNRFTSESYRVSPYIKGRVGNDLSYQLRDNMTWTTANRDSSLTNSSSVNEITGTILRTARPLGWAIDTNRADTRFSGRPDQVTELVRLRGIYQVDPQVQLSLRGGYEHDDFTLTSFSNPIYGLGLNWRPTDRTKVDAWLEHRFFGSSYDVAFSHRTPLSVWSLHASRSTTSFPQQLADLPAGADFQAILNQLFLTRVPDPVERQSIVNQFIQDRGLPPLLASPLALFTEKITLEEALIGTVGLLGARNSIFFSAFRNHHQPIESADVAGANADVGLLLSELALNQNNTQYGGGVTWSHKLTSLMTLTVGLDGSRVVATDQSRGTTRLETARAMLATPLSPLTSVFGGIRYQMSRSSVANDFDEYAVFVGLVHQFR